MSKTWIAGAVLLLGSTLNAHAQDTAPTRTPVGAPPAPARGGNQTVTVTGCVAPGHKTTTPQVSEYILNDARMSDDSQTGTAQPSAEDVRNPPGSTAATGTSGSDGTTPKPGMYFQLSAGSTDLRPHVGHRVEITGRIDSQGGASEGVTGTAGDPTVTRSASTPEALARGSDPSSSAVKGAMVHVESLRPIAGSCSGS